MTNSDTNIVPAGGNPKPEMACVDRFVPVVVPMPLDGPFTYRLPDDLEVRPGQFVSVQFGKKSLLGVVWHGQIDKIADPKRIKTVSYALDVPVLPPTILALIDRLAEQTLAPKGSLLRLAMSVPAALAPGPLKPAIRWHMEPAKGGENADIDRLLAALAPSGQLLKSEFQRASGLKPAAIKRLLAQGWLEQVTLDIDDLPLAQSFVHRPPELSLDQSRAVECIAAAFERDACAHLLLEGVPGSGKTEVYFDAIAATLGRGGTAIVLLPEIALSPQWLERFETRFGAAPAIWHSSQTAAQRRKLWKDIAKGRIKVLVGTRSALFLPFPKLDLIVIDEEHDPSYKQEDGVIYDARMAARFRAEIDRAALLMASATPTLATIEAFATHPDLHLRLDSPFAASAALRFETVNLRGVSRPKGFISQLLEEALADNLAAGRQSVLFLNRRGFAPLTTCGACGFRFECGNCTAWLTFHRYRERMLCHHCGYTRPLPAHCPDCGAVDSIVTVGPGAERVADEAKRMFPDARIALVTSDTIAGSRKAGEFVAHMEAREIDIVVGTQLIAKGHHFPHLTLVGIIDADATAGASDPCASERCFHLLYQLAGRAGRGDAPGRVLVQTRQPDDPVIEALCSGNRSEFLAFERAEREAAGLPPFGRLAALILSGRDHRDVRHLGLKLVREAPTLPGLRVLGPAPAPIAVRRGAYRERILIKADLAIDLPGELRRWLKPIKVPSRLRLAIDVDPQSFY